MRLPSTLDPRRRRSGARLGGGHPDEDDDGYEYEYLEVDDTDPGDLGDEWEWVEVEVEVDDDHDPGPDRPGRSGDRRRGRRVGRSLARWLPLTADGPDDAAPEVAESVVDGRDPRAGTDTRAATRADVVVDEDEWWEDDLDGDGEPLVDPRIAARRDGVVQARRTRRRRRLVAVAVVVALVVGLGALTRSAVLDVDEIAVSGAALADEAEIVAASGIAPGTPLLGLDLDQARAGVLAEPWILDATVDRTWSGTVSISVVERQPVATVNAGDGGWLLVDGDRRVVAASAEPPALPIVDGVGLAGVGEELGPDAQAAIDVAAALTPGLRTRVAVVNGADPDAVELTLQPSGTVRFGPATQLDERVRSLQAVFAQVDLLCLGTIDLRVPDAPVLTRVPACA